MGRINNVILTFGSRAYISFKLWSEKVNVKLLKVPSDIFTNFSKLGSYVMLEPKEVSLIGILSNISEGEVQLFETKEHLIIIELTVVPIGVSVDDIFQLTVCVVGGKVPAANPIIVLIEPVEAKTNCGVDDVVGNPAPEYKPLEGCVYVPMVASVGTRNVNN